AAAWQNRRGIHQNKLWNCVDLPKCLTYLVGKGRCSRLFHGSGCGIRMRSFPLFLKLQERPVLLAGNGDAAAAKLRLLSAAGARVRAFAETPSVELRAAIQELSVSWNAAPVTSEDLRHVELVIGAYGDEAADAALSNLARSVGKLVNIVDRPELSDFTMP